ncbi:hypothetical protein D1631_05975 [Chryseobacterium nematophagum]|uniref:Putative auto-transporter adhesin head GIN domain-containing protein n=1 Tax=Chryseobacterium nematophagum TaxID=2305228 RepID=A0A3M7TDY8_9FLAO|nr:DUF2807 domain-containing protein [Chryseobacterium nematophagum]RNA61508.1 hypothetical protein D1631_05975 [Chryseobacterium nematophagum]
MKKNILISLSTLVLASCSGDALNDEKGINTVESTTAMSKNGNYAEKTVVGSFNDVTVNNAIISNIVKSDTEKVVISAPQDIINYVVVKIVNGALNISIDKPTGIIIKDPVYATVYAKNITALTATSAAEITFKDSFESNKILFSINSAAKIKGNNNLIKANELVLNLTSSSQFQCNINTKVLNITSASSAKATVSGNADSSTIEATTSSIIDGTNLLSGRTNLKALTASRISQGVKTQADAYAATASVIKILKKDPSLVVNKTALLGGVITVE